MITVTNENIGKKYQVTEEMEKSIKTMQIQMKALIDGLGINVAVTNAYCMNLGVTSFLNEVMAQNEGKSIEELLQLQEIE